MPGFFTLSFKNFLQQYSYDFSVETECGKVYPSFGTDFISGAANDPEKNPVGFWPWMASLGFYDENKKWTHQCGATLVSQKHFLTAAHCANER